MKESTLQQQIISYLSFMAGKYHFIYFAPMNEGVSMVLSMFKVPPKTCAMINGYMRKMGFLAGVSDIMILHEGKAFCMELKTATGKQSKGQIRFEDNCIKTGVPYEIVRSLDECKKQLRRWNIV